MNNDDDDVDDDADADDNDGGNEDDGRTEGMSMTTILKTMEWKEERTEGQE